MPGWRAGEAARGESVTQAVDKQKFDGEGYASLLSQKRSRKPAFVAVKAANATRNKTAVHRFRAASFAGVLCAKRTAKTGVRPRKMSKLIFSDCRRFSYARKLSLRYSSFRRRLFVVVTKPVRQDGCPEGPSGPFVAGLGARSAQRPPYQFLFVFPSKFSLAPRPF